jgi:hypothetical protein
MQISPSPITTTQWLEAEADLDSQELLDRLVALDPGLYCNQNKRTLQRQIRDWSGARVQQQCLENAALRLETKLEVGIRGIIKRQSKRVTNSWCTAKQPES